MPENTNPVTKAETDAAAAEFDFTQPAADHPRIKRRSLKGKKSGAHAQGATSQGASLQPAAALVPAAARQLAREAPALSVKEAKPEFQPTPEQDEDAEINAAVKITEPARPSLAPAPAKPATETFRPTSTVKPGVSPHGTRPATLYYSTGTRKDAESTPPMKSTPTASAPSKSAPASAAATATPVRTTTAAAPTRPASVADYRANVERQSREQKSVGNVLAILVYCLIGFVVIGTSLAGYGAYIVNKQLRQQSATVDDLAANMNAQNKALADQLAGTKATLTATLTDAQAQIARQQDLIVKQQEVINKLLTETDENATAAHTERQTRAQENASIRARLRELESKVSTLSETTTSKQ